jgi:hypothetical protein
VLHGDLERFYYDIGDMDTLTPKIKEDIEFKRGINAKLNSKKILSLENEWLALFGPLK